MYNRDKKDQKPEVIIFFRITFLNKYIQNKLDILNSLG